MPRSFLSAGYVKTVGARLRELAPASRKIAQVFYEMSVKYDDDDDDDGAASVCLFG